MAAGEPPAKCQLIEYCLAKYHRELLLGRGPPRRVHQANLEGWQCLVADTFSGQTCLGCLRRPPQHPLTCGHAYCDVCAAGYGSPLEGAESQYLIATCVLCRRTCDNRINVLPGTAPVRALTVDGGGVRVFIPLRFMWHMQQFLGADLPVQDLFDVAFRTSAGESADLDLRVGLITTAFSGGLLVLKLCYQRESVAECRDAFEELMLRFFRSQPSANSAWGKLIRAIRCWWTNSWYDARTWDQFLREQFGSGQQMFGVQPVSGTKVAVVVSAGDAVLLANYQGMVQNADDKGESTRRRRVER